MFELSKREQKGQLATGGFTGKQGPPAHKNAAGHEGEEARSVNWSDFF